MGSKAEALRQRIIEKADELFYQNGYEKTSFSDIAAAVNISRGNFYYHFKTKDDILNAVIKVRLQNIRDMLNEWNNETEDKRQLIHRFINMMTHDQKKIKQYGCPVGSLCTELSRIKHALKNDAREILSLFREWLIIQFIALGHKEQAEHLTMHLLTRTQGISSLITSFPDDEFYQTELQALKDWLDDL